MFITVQFKNANLVFGGKKYDYQLSKGVTSPPKVGDIIRMYGEKGEKVCNATRVRVVDVKQESDKSYCIIVPKPSSLDEPSIAKGE